MQLCEQLCFMNRRRRVENTLKCWCCGTCDLVTHHPKSMRDELAKGVIQRIQPFKGGNTCKAMWNVWLQPGRAFAPCHCTRSACWSWVRASWAAVAGWARGMDSQKSWLTCHWVWRDWTGCVAACVARQENASDKTWEREKPHRDLIVYNKQTLHTHTDDISCMCVHKYMCGIFTSWRADNASTR